MPEPNPFQLQPLEPVNVKDILLKYSRNWAWFALSLIFCMTLAVVYLKYAATQYRIDSTILIADDKNGSDLSKMGGLFSDLELFQSGKNIDDQIEVLKGKTLMQRVVRELNLQVIYEKRGNLKNTEIYGTALPIKVTSGRLDSAAFEKELVLKILSPTQYSLDDGADKGVYRFGETVNKPYGSFLITSTANLSSAGKGEILLHFRDIKSLVNDCLESLSITPVNKNGNVLKLSINHTVPQKGIDLLNKLIELHNLEAIENKNEIAAKTIVFIDDRLVYLVEELSGVEKDVETYKQKNDVTDISSESQQYLQNTVEYEQKLSEYDIQISILQSIQNYMTDSKGQTDLVPSSLSIQDATLTELINNYNQLQLQRNRLLKSNYENSPVAVNLAEQLVSLRQNILENIKNIKKGLAIARNSLQNKNTKFENLKQHVPSIERQLLEIKRQQSIKETLYQYLLQKREEASLSKAASVASVQIIDKADVDNIPVKPRRSVIIILAFMAALLLPVSGISLISLFNNKVSIIEDIKKIGAPVLGEILHAVQNERFLVRKENRTVLSELFRLLRSKLQISATEDKNKTILVTSTMSGEGKTFFCINMGATLALAGKKVVLLEFDLRKPKLLSDIGLSVTKGITNYLVSNKIELDDLITKVPDIDNLYVIGCGQMPPNPSELLLSERMNELFTILKEKFDHIIIDSPPVALIADTYSLAPFADRTLYLIRYNYTLKNQVGIVKEIFEEKTLKNMMLIMNDGRRENVPAYNYGYQYNYGYEKKYEKKPWFKRIFSWRS
ncbi:GumC family protein [Pedobacter psychroterrae]|uniref:non-specific protein-tyrosine kinase n=1 Tax=Pedobacter psychroterrae TaxID=2530453 RepID=A0A4R0NC00_9SPHI|nr:tyrosine-protein kinase [Pedobacter psychroterrae]TCC96813.1 polysaccharide biosynthesis tyrosine autokinase [Pedobacter psychroterrae]